MSETKPITLAASIHSITFSAKRAKLVLVGNITPAVANQLVALGGGLANVAIEKQQPDFFDKANGKNKPEHEAPSLHMCACAHRLEVHEQYETVPDPDKPGETVKREREKPGACTAAKAAIGEGACTCQVFEEQPALPTAEKAVKNKAGKRGKGRRGHAVH